MKKLFTLALAATMSTGAVAFGPATGFLLAQAVSTNGGSIQGTITDPSGAIVGGASVNIHGTDTGFDRTVTTDSAGLYSVGPLNPGNYRVTVTSGNFQKMVVNTVIRTGTVTSGSFKLTVGSSTETVEVTAGSLQVNTEQAGVSDVLTNEQIQSLPINGRNFLDVAQIEPGVILQSGESFDPTKAGYSAISVSGVSGRTTRILLDGQDITDETVGTTIFNVSQGAISEFQLNRSTQDVSGDVTSTGQVLVATQNGTNKFHGQAFYNFQDYRALFANVQGQKAPFQRNQYGGSIGGPIFKDKLFFFGNAERIKQDSSSPITIGSAFPQFVNLALGTPYRETYSTARLDYSGPYGGHFFVRANYNVNAVDSSFGSGFQRYANRDNTPGLAGGADFQVGRFTHSFRGSYEKFHNLITDASSGIFNLIPGVTFQNTSQSLQTGPNDLAPQGTFQSDKQIRYDGTWTKGQHSFKYGYSLNRIQGGGFAAFFGLAPRVRENNGTALAGANKADPLTGYHPSSIVLGNGLGFFTENSGFGLIGGGVADWREAGYVSDSWKATPNLTMNVGVRYSIDTGRANQDINTPLCSDLSSTLAATQVPCTGATPLFSAFNPAYTQTRVNQPYRNVAPQIGFAYAPGDHRTVLTGAYGIFFEGDVFNNTTNARTGVLKSGPFFGDVSLCGAGQFTQPDGSVVTTLTAGGSTETIAQVCAGTVGAAAPFAIAAQALYQANSAKNATSANGSFIGQTLSASGIYAPNYKSPYSQQWNFGIQREISKGSILRADYVHNSTLKIAQSVDQNHLGAARYFNLTAAQAALSKTTAKAHCAGGYSAAAVNCAIAYYGGRDGTTGGADTAIISQFAGNGLDSGGNYNSGNAAGFAGHTVAGGAAFPGANPLLGSGSFLTPIGRSGYDALQVVYRQSKTHPLPFVDRSSIQISYNLSRIVSSSGGGSDQFFSNGSFDNDNPSEYIGRAGLDHKHQVSFGGSFVMKYGPQIGVVGHFYSAAPSNLTLDAVNPNGNIFQSDLTGDGTTGDLAPGTLPGDYMHRIKPSNLGAYIQNFNQTYANALTPAGQVLVNSGLFTQQQLIAIGGAVQPISGLPQARALGNSAVRALDVNFSYPIRLNRFREGMNLEPAISFYNVGNFSNFGGPSGVLQSVADAGPVNSSTGNVNGQDVPGVLEQFRTGRGSGTFDQNGPRSTEFQLKLNF